MTMIIVVALVASLFSANCAKGQKVTEELVILKTEIENFRSALSAGNERITKLTAILEGQNHESGSTYIRWGRTTCEGDAKVVYDGFAAGKFYNHVGSGSNYICLSREPKWGKYDDINTYRGSVYGIEYEHLFDVHDEDAPCVVCRIPRSNILMTPGTNECQDEWVQEYSGYLVSQRELHPSTEYVCLDENPEGLKTSSGNKNGGLFYLVEGRCGSLQCPPYVNGRELTCVVCSYGKRG